MKKKHITDNQIRRFFWEYDKSPLDNKASYLLGDLSNYGVSRCLKFRDGFKGVYYEFDIYREENSVISLVVQLPLNFKLKDVQDEIVYLWKGQSTIASNSKRLFHKWVKKINPEYSYEHSEYSAMRFLEELRKRLTG